MANKRSFFITDSTGHAALELDIHSHKESKVIIINCPDGKNDLEKWGKIGRFLVLKNVGAFVQMPNTKRTSDYARHLIEDVWLVCEYVLNYALEICATANPDIYLMGCDEGASAIAAMAREFPQIKKVLLIAPASLKTDRPEYVEESFAQFTGQVSITVGMQDDVDRMKNSRNLFFAAKNAESERITLIPNCDYHFTGRKNGEILIRAPLWAFADDLSYPSPEGGLVLY